MTRLQRYASRGAARVRRISAALERCNVQIIDSPDPTLAPFEYRVRTPEGELLDLICYAFTANKYRQGNRPSDEHRFQVKYGGDFDREHQLYIDPTRRRVTLMFGVHDELDLFVAVDPAMHRVTWFSSSIEFKDHDLRKTIESGWHGWERERMAQGRRRANPEADLRVESVLGVRADQFLRYMQFERVATGLDPGERLLLIDRLGRELDRAPESSVSRTMVVHPLEQQFGLAADEILQVIQARARLLTAVLGGIAEWHLQQYLSSACGITDVERLEQDGPPDFRVRYRNRKKLIRIECKNVRGRVYRDRPWVDFQKTRAAKSDPCSRYYSPAQFEVLAACLHPITERWEFRFCETAKLSPHTKCPGKLSEKVIVEESWPEALPDLLDRLPM